MTKQHQRRWWKVGAVTASTVVMAVCAIYQSFPWAEWYQNAQDHYRAPADIKSLQMGQASLLSDIKQIKEQNMRIMRALKLPVNPPAEPSSANPNIPKGVDPYLWNVLNHNTRAENQAKRIASGNPPMPSKTMMPKPPVTSTANNQVPQIVTASPTSQNP